MKSSDVKILNFVGGLDKTFIIPPFQRNYEWGKDQCTELFKDILQSCKTGKAHYLGNIVYYEGKNSGASYTEFVLIDGQQRVTSVLILLCALRDSIEDANVKESINKRYLLNDTSDNRYRIRLKQTAYDSSSFIAIIDGEEPENKDSHVVRNYNLFKTLIKNCSGSYCPIDIYETIPKLEVVEVNLQVIDDLKAVQTVFEKINSTGKVLTPADLIRNLLLLTKSADEQERLYSKYWLKIEETLKSENITRFSRDYIIMQTFSDVPEKQVYSLFKSYLIENDRENEDILDEMEKFSKYYAWIIFESCQDEVINRCIKMLNILKTDDVYPLYLYLLFQMFQDQKSELRHIFILITDFMIRYRVVTPATGGGALRSVVQELIEKLSSEIECTREAILYELSNSATPTGRFPDDNEFTQKLMSSVNPLYARVILLKIEENETHNIPVDINKVTVEHLMPQTLSAWWKSHLGGEEDAERIRTEYLNSIGNLTPVSQGYNSSMSNKPWGEKISVLKNVQFTITSVIADKYPEWNEANIRARNELISNKAVQAVAGPLKRTRQYRTKSSEDYVRGVYPLADISTPMNGASIVSVHCYNNRYECTRWKDLLVIICRELYSRDQQHFEQIIIKNAIHKATRKKNYPQKDPVITRDRNLLLVPMSIPNTPYFSEGCLSNLRARVFTKQLLDEFKCSDEYSIEIE